MNRLLRILIFTILLGAILSWGYVAAPPPTTRPDSGTAPFRAEEVTIDTGPVTLAGTLLTPPGETPAPAVIIVPGSGAATRDGSWNMYRSIAEYLIQRGLAVLLYDKRGVGGSSGDWQSETFDERAQDVAAMLTYLQGREEIDPQRIGLIGHSQGAYIAPLVATEYSNDVKFVVLLAGPAERVWDQVLTNERAESLGNGLPETEVDARIADLQGQLRFLDGFQSPCRSLRAHYLCFVLDYDPTPVLKRLTIPTLALYAELDTQVPPDVNIPLLDSALEKAGNTSYTIYTFEKANHWFAAAETGTTAEMRELMRQGDTDRYDFVPGFLEMMGAWIVEQLSNPLER